MSCRCNDIYSSPLRKAADTIADYASKNKMEIVIMATHGDPESADG